MKIKILCFCCLLSFFTKAQTQINFAATINNKPLIMNELYQTQNDTLSINNLRFYISKIELYQDEQTVWTEENSFHLIDFKVENTLGVVLKTPSALRFNRLRCYLGIDSLTNEMGAQGGDLDPTKGMYWAWQSGYINFKLEGKNAKCPTYKNQFQFHLGGFLAPHNALQYLDFDIKNVDNQLFVNFDINHFLENVDFRTQHTFMKPDSQSVFFAKKSKASFSLK